MSVVVHQLAPVGGRIAHAAETRTGIASVRASGNLKIRVVGLIIARFKAPHQIPNPIRSGLFQQILIV